MDRVCSRRLLPVLIASGLGSMAVCSALAQAQDPAAATNDLQAAYESGLKAFGKGDYPSAVKNMELIIEQAPPGAPLDTVYYMLGAAAFNQADYRKAIEALQKYLSKYPKGPKVKDAIFFIGQAQVQSKDIPAAARTLAPLENNQEYRDRIFLLLGSGYKDAGKVDDAIAMLKKLTDGGVRTTVAANGAVLLAGIYIEKGESDKAVALLQALRKSSELMDNVIRMNSLAIDLGDALLKQEKPAEALACYLLVRSRDEVLKLQNARLAAMQRQIDANFVALRAEPKRVLELNAQTDEIRRAIAQAKAQLATFEKTPDFQGPFLLRVARAYYGMEKKWEAITVYDELLRREPNGPEREAAFFGLVGASAEAGRTMKCQELADLYLKEFPTSANANTVAYLQAVTTLQSGDNEKAAVYFERILETQPKSSYREQVRSLLANARFSLSQFDKASKEYTTYLQDYPKGNFAQEATYRQALCPLFAGKNEDAVKQLKAYLAKYPDGQYVADAKYRLNVCKFAASDYEGVIADADAWAKDYPNDRMSGEVLALKGDALAGLDGRETEAIDVYLASAKLAQNDEVLSHSLFEGAKLLQKQGEWEKIGTVFQDFVRDNPKSPLVVAAVYWIGRAKTKEGKTDEAKQIIADAIKLNINDPQQNDVEQLITQLAQLCARKQAPGPDVDGKRPVAPPDPTAEMASLLAGDEKSTPTAQARILFAQAELARLRKDPAGQETNLASIAETFPPDSLSPVLLAQVGDYLLAKGELDKAAGLFKSLKEEYPKSDLLDFAYNGFGEIAYEKKDYPAALQFYTDAIDKAGATQKLKEVTIGQAKTLLAMNRLDEAKKLFTQIAGTREWRGDATAYSVYSLGEIEEKKGHLPEAIAFYQRVYVSYGRFLPWVAKAYVRSAECFDKLGKKPETVNTYREMLRNEKLSKFPEYLKAQKYLEGVSNG